MTCLIAGEGLLSPCEAGAPNDLVAAGGQVLDDLALDESSWFTEGIFPQSTATARRGKPVRC